MAEQLGRILIIDDGQDEAEILAHRLRRRGYAVTIATTANSGLETAEAERFDLVVLDPDLRDSEDLETIKTIRKKYSRAELPIIVNTMAADSQEVVRAIAAGANDHVSKEDEIDVLLARIGTNVILKQTNDRLASANEELRATNRRLEEELDSAARIQRSQLPSARLKVEGCELAWQYKPCSKLGGDFLNVTQLDDDHLGLYMLDASGHGPAASLLAIAVNRLLLPSPNDTGVVNRSGRIDKEDRNSAESIPANITEPVQVLRKLQRRFPLNSDSDAGYQFFTIVYSVMNIRNGMVWMTSAGHPRPIIVRSNVPAALMELECAPPIGVLTGTQVVRIDQLQAEPMQTQIMLQLEPGESLYFYTDGIVETLNPAGEMYGVERLVRSIDEHRNRRLNEVMTEIMYDVRSWRQDRPQDDDLSLLAVRYG